MRVKRSTLEEMEDHVSDVAKRIEAIELHLEERASMAVASGASSTSSKEEPCERNATTGRRTHQPKTPPECCVCGKLGHKSFQCKSKTLGKAVEGKWKHDGHNLAPTIGERG